MHLFYHGRIPWKPAWIEILHLPREGFHFFCRLRIATDHLPKLLELPYLLADAAFRIGGIAGGVRWRGLLLAPRARRIVAGIVIAPRSAIPATTASSRFTPGTIAAIPAPIAARIATGQLLASGRLPVAA
jgi:hypothetical protein